MTYCCGILVHEGLVMIADTRTNAGLDNIAVFRKLHTFATPGERIMAIASSGNLSVTQTVLRSAIVMIDCVGSLMIAPGVTARAVMLPPT